MKQTARIIFMAAVAFALAVSDCQGRDTSGPLNRPYSDGRALHLGFYFGTHVQDLRFSHTGFVDDGGNSWFVEQPGYAPGFNVGGLLDMRLNEWFNLRFSPGIFFGSRDVRMVAPTSGGTMRQNIKSALVAVPVDIKYSSLRYRNARPYLLAGVMPAFDVTKKRTDYIKLKSADCYVSVGFGCDFYLPFFKLNPEIRFCFGLADILDHKRPDLTDEPDRMKITRSIRRATSRMIVLSFYFE